MFDSYTVKQLVLQENLKAFYFKILYKSYYIDDWYYLEKLVRLSKGNFEPLHISGPIQIQQRLITSENTNFQGKICRLPNLLQYVKATGQV